MKVTKGTITKIDKGTKTVAVKSADGTEKTFDYTDNAAKDLAKEAGKGMEKVKVTAYRAEETGKDCPYLRSTTEVLHVDEQSRKAASATHEPDLSAMRVLPRGGRSCPSCPVRRGV